MYLPPAELVELVCRFVVLLWFFGSSPFFVRPSIDRSMDAGRQALCVSTSHHSLTHASTDRPFIHSSFTQTTLINGHACTLLHAHACGGGGMDVWSERERKREMNPAGHRDKRN